MRRRLAVTTFAACVFLSSFSRDALAEDDEPSSTPASAPSAPIEEASPRSVRVHVRLEREKDVADVMVERRGTWTVACQAPCTVDAKAGDTIRIAMQDLLAEPLAFTVTDDGSGHHDVEIRRRGRGYLVGGLVAIGAGAISLALGMAIIRGAGKEDLFGEGNRAVATIAMLLGAASAATGAVMILRRSTEPMLGPSPPTRTQALQDLMPARSYGGAEGARAPQLIWSTSF